MHLKALTAAVLLMGAFYAPAVIAQDQPKPAAPAASARPTELKNAAISVEDAAALIAVIRSRAAPDASPVKVPDVLREPSQLPLIVTFYSADGPVQEVAFEANLYDSAVKAADALIARLSKSGHVLYGVLELNVVVGRKNLAETRRLLLLREFDPGVEGMICHSVHGAAYFTPTTLLRNWATLEGASADVVKSAYFSQESAEPLRFDSVEQIQTLGFVESGRSAPSSRSIAATSCSRR